MTRHAAIYTRVSTSGQEEDGSSLATQEAACRGYAADHDIPIDERLVFRETHSGAALWEREQLTILRDAMRQHAVTDVICYAVDRLSRSQIHLGLLLSEAERAGVTLHFVTEPLENTPVGVFLQSARAFAAELEREKIRERSMRGKRARVTSGKLHSHGTDLYGYRRTPNGRRVIVEAEAAVIRDVYAWCVGGQSLRAIARRLNSAGVPSPGHAERTDAGHAPPRWDSAQVRGMLRNPAYKGETILWHTAARTKDTNRNRRAFARAEAEWVRLPEGTTPAIVDGATWDAAQAQLAANLHGWRYSGNLPCLLRGHIYCARCGRRMSPNRLTSGLIYYQCSSRHTPAGRCGARMVRAERVDAWAWQRVVAILSDPDLLTRGRRAQPKVRDNERHATQRAIARIAREQARLVERFGQSDDPAFPWQLVEQRIAALQRERIREQERLDALATPPVEPDRLVTLADYVRRAKANLATFTFEDKRLALRTLGVRVTAEGPDERDWTLTLG